MASGSATRRYYGGLVLAVLVLIGGSLAVSALGDTDTPTAVLVALAAVPVLALLSMFWLQWRYVVGLDEYLRHLHAKALLVATAIALGVGTGWGYLEIALDLPPLQVYWLNPLFWVVYAMAVVFLSRRDSEPEA